MFKSLVTLLRGTVHVAADSGAGRTVFAILDRRMGDWIRTVERARRALELAKSQRQEEREQIGRTNIHIAKLENMACQALDAGDERRAAEAADAIVCLEAEKEAGEAAQETITLEMARLNKLVKQCELRVVELRRGQRIAAAAERANRLRGDEITSTSLPASPLEDAECALTRLRQRQADFQRRRRTLDEFDTGVEPSSIPQRVAEVGCGPSTRTAAGDVLARLRRCRPTTVTGKRQVTSV